MSFRIATPRAVKNLPRSCHHHRRRSFFDLTGSSSPLSGKENFTAIRNLPYSQESLYKLIADVDAYSAFIPYCSHSRVTKWSEPDQQGRVWPILADLHLGWGIFNEVFTSKLRCVPNVSVEAVSGNPASNKAKPASNSFRSLVTRWDLRPVPPPAQQQQQAMTEVKLNIKYQFVNPLYAAVTAPVSHELVDFMIEAFEKRASEQFGKA
ncbi:hypothetical protein E4U21_001629 [Claviceps maximensis]|nr:hypothetical protein E4U21_001629 [Claviceps maximensis]